MLRQATQPTLVVAWDNTANYFIGKNLAGEDIIMPSFVLSNRGAENSADASDEPTSYDPQLLTTPAQYFALELEQHGIPNDIHLNLVYCGGFITRQYSSRRHSAELLQQGITHTVQSLQLGYNTKLTHCQQTLVPLNLNG